MALPVLILAVALASTDPAPVRLTLRQVLELAAQRYPELQVVAAERQGAESLRSLARWTRFSPRLTDTTVFGLVPAARGNILSSPDTPRDLNDLGFFYRTRVDASLPLFTFGRLKAAEQAAESLVASKDAKAKAKVAAAQALAARAYFGYLLADRDRGVLDDVRKDLEKLLDRLEHPQEGDPEADPLDPLRARNYGFELDKQGAKAERRRDLASVGLAELVGMAGTAVQPAASDLTPLPAEVPELEAAVAEALANDPEVREVELAAAAKGLWAEVARKESLPTLSVEGRFDYGEARNRDKQDNPFVYEPFNVRSLTAAFGLRWELNYFQNRARAGKDLAEAAELRAKREALVARTRVDVAEARGLVIEAQKVHEAARKALSTGANWLRIADENYHLEAASLKDLIEAYRAFLETRVASLEAIHDLNLRLVEWRLALGRPPLEPGEAP